jgi:hypothetical protein
MCPDCVGGFRHWLCCRQAGCVDLLVRTHIEFYSVRPPGESPGSRRGIVLRKRKLDFFRLLNRRIHHGLDI